MAILPRAINGVFTQQARPLHADAAVSERVLALSARVVDLSVTLQIAANMFAAFSNEPPRKNKSLELLISNLTPRQRKSLFANGFFTVTAQSGERYKITTDAVFNVKLLAGNNLTIGAYCAVPSISVPKYDKMLAQKLLLETDESKFLNTAIWWQS